MQMRDEWILLFLDQEQQWIARAGWVTQSPPISLSSAAELGSSEEERQMASERSVLPRKLSCVLLISSAASSACVSCISSSSPFSLSKSQAWKSIESAYVRLSSLLTPKWNALWFVKFNQSAWKLMLSLLWVSFLYLQGLILLCVWNAQVSADIMLELRSVRVQHGNRILEIAGIYLEMWL